MRNVYRFIGFLIVVLFFVVLIKKLPNNDEVISKFHDEFLNLNIKGVVNEKYINKSQHNYPMIKVESIRNENSYQLINFVREASGLYDMISIGDTLKKDSGDINILIINNFDTINYNKVYFK